MTLENAQVEVGDSVTIVANQRRVTTDRVGGYGYRDATFDAGDTLRVTRVGSEKVLVRRGDEYNGVSGWVYRQYLEFTDQLADRTPKRKPGVKPEGDDYIDPRDPRLEWFWDDVSSYAAKSQYCSTFDSILRDLNLPPRKQEYAVTVSLGEFSLTTRRLARSQAEAQVAAQRDLDEQFEAKVQRAVEKVVASIPSVDVAEAIANAEGEAE